jgi:small subunit ribosomal protein S19
MTRSIKKGINIDERLLKKIAGKNPLNTPMIKTWNRAAVISPEMVGFTFGVYNGKLHIAVLVTEDMVGHRLGEFSSTRKFIKHGGKMQKELEQKKKEAEIAQAKAATTTAAASTTAKKK